MFDKVKQFFAGSKAVSNRAKQTILLVDDNVVDLQFVKRTLERSGYQVITAENGRVGLEKVGSEHPDLAILDCEMPEMGGLELCRQIKQNESTKDIPVVFLTSLDTPKNIIDCFELEAENFLAKPINSKILVNRVKEILEDRAEGIKVVG